MKNKKDELEQFKSMEDHTPAPEDPSQTLSPRRRTALVTYLAFLFALAFLFVALTMALEAKRVKMINEALEDSSQKTSASLTSSINALQKENCSLLDNKAQLEAQLAELQGALKNSVDQEQNSSKQIEACKSEIQKLEAEKAELLTQLETLNQQAQDAVTVSELLQKAIALNEDGNLSSLSEVLSQIEPLKDLLSETEKEIYDSLVVD